MCSFLVSCTSLLKSFMQMFQRSFSFLPYGLSRLASAKVRTYFITAKCFAKFFLKNFKPNERNGGVSRWNTRGWKGAAETAELKQKMILLKGRDRGPLKKRGKRGKATGRTDRGSGGKPPAPGTNYWLGDREYLSKRETRGIWADYPRFFTPWEGGRNLYDRQEKIVR